MQIPQQVAYIIDKLNTRGFEAYAVGGCVRDTLLGREPGDWDITTSAKPEQVKALFRRTVDTGIQHGTVTVLIDRTGYEVTTYRIDGIYEDGRHPRQVEFTSDLLEDLRRRDFTINAMAYSHDKGIVDAFDGMGDLKRKVIRCVGNPMERFSEDALRILRAIRFSAQLDFSIEKETWEAIGQIAPNIAKVSRERIQVELTKLLLSDHPERMMDVFETGISRYIFGESYQLLRGKPDVPENISRLLKETALSERRNLQEAAKLPGKKYIRWAAFLSRAGADGAVRILKLVIETIRRVKTLVSWAGRELPEEEAFVRRGMSQMEPEVWDGVLDLNGYSPAIREMTRRIRERGDCLDLKHLAVSGQDLIAAGVTPGKEMGEILGRLLEHVLERPEDNRKEVLLGLGKPDVPVEFRNSIPSAAVRVQEALNCRQKLEQ